MNRKELLMHTAATLFNGHSVEAVDDALRLALLLEEMVDAHILKENMKGQLNEHI